MTKPEKNLSTSHVPGTVQSFLDSCRHSTSHNAVSKQSYYAHFRYASLHHSEDKK